MKHLSSLIFLTVFLGFQAFSQNQEDSQDLWSSKTFSGLKFRSIGPALMSGRIADIAIHPQNDSKWYVAVGSGGLWRTENAGTTWTPIFDDQDCYSTGCVSIDPNNPDIIWLGTGENVGGRHVSFGCGIYRSADGGKSWKNMGLKNSEHLSKIIVHPDNSDVVWVASQGPLWSPGGERGVYKTINAGKTWKRVLGDDEWKGATDLVIDPQDPRILYAASWERHRTVAAYLGGGPGTGLYKSTDGGENWVELKNGLPKSKMGKIGLAISPQKSNVLYAAIELDRRNGAVYKSVDSGSSWKKMSETVSGGTGPHYYQELYACPHQFDRLYLMDVRVQISEDGGKTFRRMKEKYKHSDNHAMAFKQGDPDYLLFGTDGGLYESYDLGEHWRFFPNLPLTQFYKIAVDDAEPFYNVYGGTQDNSTEGGPSRTDNIQGIQNGDWKVVLNWDGHQPATEPGNPNIMYGQRQQGTLSRIDLKTGEVIDIKPQPDVDDPHERFNWDAPILVSSHDPKRIYFASQRLWRSDNRGDSWTAISGDLTRNENRIELPIMGRKQSFDNAWDLYAMSNYNTITSIAESPMNENLLYIGTDDGMIHVSDNGGESWTKILVNQLPKCPERAYVNDIKADLFDENTVYIALDNHKEGDYQPYIYKSTNKGKTWKSIQSNLAKPILIWRMVQDHKDPKLMFIGTEFGVFFTQNGGEQWTQLKGALPTISIRDLTIHRRDEDLVCGSFGRSIYIFDDIEVFRSINEEVLKSEAALLSAGDAWWYIPRPSLSFGKGNGSQGSAYFVAPNPPYGAVFSYYLKDGYKSAEELRKKSETKADTSNMDIVFPGWDALDEEFSDSRTKIWFTIRDEQGEVIRRMSGPSTKGFHRVAWDLRFPAPQTIPAGKEKWEKSGLLALPGKYSVSMSIEHNGAIQNIGYPLTFNVNKLHKPSLKGNEQTVTEAFWRKYESLLGRSSALNISLRNKVNALKSLETAMLHVQSDNEVLLKEMYELRIAFSDFKHRLNGSPAKKSIGEKTDPTIGERLFALNRSLSNSTYGPTSTNKESLSIVETQLGQLEEEWNRLMDKTIAIRDQIIESGGPRIEGLMD